MGTRRIGAGDGQSPSQVSEPALRRSSAVPRRMSLSLERTHRPYVAPPAAAMVFVFARRAHHCTGPLWGGTLLRWSSGPGGSVAPRVLPGLLLFVLFGVR